MAKTAWVIMLAAAAAGCGARSALLTDIDPGPDASVDASIDVRDASVDVSIDVPDVRDVVVPPLDAPVCANDLDCDDGVLCTRDVCDRDTGRCSSLPEDAVCDDGAFCNGPERCDAVRGCLAGFRPCFDGIGCTHDRCTESTRCNYDPDDTLCPLSHVCDAKLGCQARALAHSGTDLYDVRLPSGEVRRIGPTRVSMTDLALHPSGRLYGVTFNTLVEVNGQTGATAPVASVLSGLNALDAAPDGTLYAAGGQTVYIVDRVTGAASGVALLPGAWESSGDLAFLGNRLLLTTRLRGSTTADTLFEIDPVLHTSRNIGLIGHRCVYGLAAFGPTLYGLTCDGKVLSINPATGFGIELTRTAVQFYGATAR